MDLASRVRAAMDLTHKKKNKKVSCAETLARRGMGMREGDEEMTHLDAEGNGDAAAAPLLLAGGGGLRRWRVWAAAG